MTLTVELSKEQEAQLVRQANAAGVLPAEYIRTLILTVNGQPTSLGRPKTGAEVLKELDALDLPAGYGDPSIDSPELARKLSAEFSRSNHIR